MSRAKKKSRKKRRRVLAVILILVAVLLTALIAVYVAIGFYFKDHFWYQTTINGVDCSKMTVAEVQNIITEETGKYQLVLKERGDRSETITSVDIGLKPVFDGSLERALESRSIFTWPVSLFRETTYEFETMVACEEEKLQETIDSLECLQPGINIEPEDAYLSEYIEGKGYEVIPEVEGAYVDVAVLKEAMHTSIINLEKELSMEEAGCYLEPKVRSDDETLVKLAEDLNSYLKASITLEFGETKEVLDGSTLHTWLSVDENNQVSFDESKVTEFVAKLANKYDTYGKTRTFKTHYGSTVQLSRNEYGWKMNQSAEIEQILSEIRSGAVVSREANFSRRARSFGENDFGGTYVEVNITAQHLYMYKNGEVIVDTDVITGDLATNHGTPSGAFDVDTKVPGKTLRGADYATWVDRWMPFNGGIGLHDCTWHSEFGGGLYKIHGSHGCINIPPEQAFKIYDNISVGDAVIVYELPGTEDARSFAVDDAIVIMQLIKDIGTVTWDSESAIQTARSAYNAASDMVRYYVDNYADLVSAEAAFQELVDARQEQQDAEQAKRDAQPVIDAINALGEVTAESRPAVEAARSKYNALSDKAKACVTNLQTLVDAEAALNAMAEGNE